MEQAIIICYWYALIFGAAMYSQRRWVHEWPIMPSLVYGAAFFAGQLVLASVLTMVFNT